MSIDAQIIDQRVRKLAEDLREPLSAQINCGKDEHKLHSAAFVFLVQKSVLDLPDDEVIDTITDGGQDFGVDALYHGPIKDDEVAITLVQGKYSKDLEKDGEFPQGGVESMIQAVRLLFDPKAKLTVNPRLEAKVEEIRSLIAEGVIPTVHVILCNNGRRWNNPAQEIIDAARFGDQVTWQHIGPENLLSLLKAAKPVNDQITLSGQAIQEDFSGFRRTLIGRIAVGQLAGLFDRNSDRLLERNIRRYLGLTGNRVNEAIQNTLTDPTQRENFYFYNNGITIICSRFRVNQLAQEDWQVRIEGLQIVNGGQTSKTVQQVVKDCPEAASAQVLIRIYELPEEDADLVLNITEATNSQNPVDLRDLRSNDRRQKDLAQAISDLGYVYRPKRGEPASSPKDITSATAAEAVLAVWRHMPHKARFNSGDHFGNLYDKIFTADLNGAQTVLAVLLLRIAENKRKRPPTDAPEFLPYASRYIAMLMGRELLKAMELKHGNQLDHRIFIKAEKLIESLGEDWFQIGINQINRALKPFFDQPNCTLQRLSAQFRRYDLVETLLLNVFD